MIDMPQKHPSLNVKLMVNIRSRNGFDDSILHNKSVQSYAMKYDIA